jgi:hypothetical protein
MKRDAPPQDERFQQTGLGDLIRDYGQQASAYLHDLTRDKPEPRAPVKVVRNDLGEVILPEGVDAKSPEAFAYLDAVRAQETGDVVAKGTEFEHRSPQWYALKTEGFDRLQDEPLERSRMVETRDPGDPDVRNGFFAHLNKRYPDGASREQMAREAAWYLAGPDSQSPAAPELVEQLLNVDTSGKKKKRGSYSRQELERARRVEYDL